MGWFNNTLGRGSYILAFDCRNGGPHRWSSLHFMRKRNVTIRVCRLCDAERIVQYDVTNGKLVEKVLKTSTHQKNSNTSINQHESKITDNDTNK